MEEPQDDLFTQYAQLEILLMGDSKDMFRLPELPESNRAQPDNPTVLPPMQVQWSGDASGSANDGVRIAQHWSGSSADNNGPPGFNVPMGHQMSNDIDSSSRTSYIINAPSPIIKPVQWRSTPAQTSSVAQVVTSSSPNPSLASGSTLVGQYNSPTQPQVISTMPSSQTSTNNPSPPSATTQPVVQRSNLPPAPANMPPPPTTCNNTLQAAPISNNVPPSTANNVSTHLQQAAWSNNDSQRAPNNPMPPVATNNAGSSSSLADRFTAASQGVGLSTPRAYSSLNSPLYMQGFGPFAEPNSTDLPSQYGGAYGHGLAMEGAGYGPQVAYPPQMAAAVGGSSQDTAFLPPMHNNNVIAKQKQQEGGTMKPRGRPRGSTSRKRQAQQPQWDEEAEYEMRESVRRVRKPYYNPRRELWQEMRLSGVIPGRAQMSSSSPGDQMDYNMMLYDGGQGWDCYYQGQLGDLSVGMMNQTNNQLGSINNQNNVCRAETMATDQVPAAAGAQFGNAPSEVLQVAPRQVNNNNVSYGPVAPPSSGVLFADENPNKFWSFGSNPTSSTAPFPSQNAAKGIDQTLITDSEKTPPVSNKGKQPVEDHSQFLPVQAATAATRNKSSMDQFCTGSSSNYEQHRSSTCIDFENSCVGGRTQEQGEGSNKGFEDASASAGPGVQGNSSCNKQLLGSATTFAQTDIVAETNNNPTNLPSFPKATPNQVSNQFPISVNDYIVDYDPFQLTDEDLVACALREPFQSQQSAAASNVAQTNDKPTTVSPPSVQSGVDQEQQVLAKPTNQEATFNSQQPMQEQVTTGAQQTHQAAATFNSQQSMQEQVTAAQQTHQAATFNAPANPVQVVVERPGIAQQTAQAATFSHAQPMQSGLAQQVPTLGNFQTNSSSQQLAQQANTTQNECNVNINNANNNQPSMAPPQPFRNSSAQYAPQVMDGNSGAHQTYMQNSAFDGNINPAVHQGSSSTAPPATRPRRARNSGPTAYYYYQKEQQLLRQQQMLLLQQQQLQANSANGPRPCTMPPPPLQPYQTSGSLNSLQQYYPYSRPTRATRRRRQNTQTARNAAMDFNQCAVTPGMFNDMVHDGYADSILGSELWPGLSQDEYNRMVMSDPTLLNPERLQERIAQINSGLLPMPNLLNSMSMNQHQADYSAPPAANRMMNYGPPGMQSDANFQQGLGVAAGVNNYNFADPNAMGMMNANNITNFQNQQPQNLQGQITPNMQQVQPNFGNWSEYPAPSSSRISEEIQQPVPVNISSTVLTSTQENLNYNPPQQHAAAPTNQQATPNPAYDPMFGASYAPGGSHM